MNFDENFLDEEFFEFLNNNNIDSLSKMNINQFETGKITLKLKETEEQIKIKEEARKKREMEERKRKEQKEEENKRKAFDMVYKQIKFICKNDKNKEMELIKKYKKEAEYKKYVLGESNENEIVNNKNGNKQNEIKCNKNNLDESNSKKENKQNEMKSNKNNEQNKIKCNKNNLNESNSNKQNKQNEIKNNKNNLDESKNKNKQEVIIRPTPKVYLLVKNLIVGSRMLFFEKGECSLAGCKRCKQLLFLNKNLKNKVERVYGILKQIQRKYYNLKKKLEDLTLSSKKESKMVENKMTEIKMQDYRMLKIKMSDLEEINENLKQRVIELTSELKQKEELIRKNEIVDKQNQLHQIGTKINKFKTKNCFEDFSRIKKYKMKMDDLKFKQYQEEIELIKDQVNEEINEQTTATESDSTSEYSSYLPTAKRKVLIAFEN